MPTPQDLIDVAAGEVGYSRWTDPKPGTKYGRWYAALTGESYYGQSGVPYCAMFVSWCAAQIALECPGLPGAYCPDMLAQAKRAGACVSVKDAKMGDIVYFDWGSDGESDHVGIVTANRGSYLETIEGNTSDTSGGSQTNGGVVARKTRPYNVVCGVVRPRYSGSGGQGGTDAQKLEITGKIDPKTVAEWQRQMGTEPDGVVSGQLWECMEQYPALTSVTYEGDGSQLMLAVQRKVGIPNPTGVIAAGTVCYVQGWLWMRGYPITDPAGVLDTSTAKGIQRSLNDGAWGE